MTKAKLEYTTVVADVAASKAAMKLLCIILRWPLMWGWIRMEGPTVNACAALCTRLVRFRVVPEAGRG